MISVNLALQLLDFTTSQQTLSSVVLTFFLLSAGRGALLPFWSQALL